MGDIVLIAVTSLLGTIIGTFGGIISSQKILTIKMEALEKTINLKIDNLEKKQDKHNCLIERMAIVEQSTKSAHHRLDEVKEKIA
jgi:hypothetical protein